MRCRKKKEKETETETETAEQQNSKNRTCRVQTWSELEDDDVRPSRCTVLAAGGESREQREQKREEEQNRALSVLYCIALHREMPD